MEQQSRTISRERRYDRNARILVAPNSYKESASSVKAAGVMVRELHRLGYENVTSLPLSDGGDGFLEVCIHQFGLQTLPFAIGNCYDGSSASVTAGYDPSAKTAYVEAADIIGLKLIPKERRDPLRLNSRNFGEFLQMLTLTDFGIEKLVIGIGGTGITDLGLGLCGVFGLRLFDEEENELEIIPENYLKVHRMVLPSRIHAKIDVVLDVECALLGELGMTKTFAPQKGADEHAVAIIEAGVENILTVLKRDHQINLRYDTIGAGGGIMLGLSLLNDVQMNTSRTFVLNGLDLQEELERCDVIITGEGSFDSQSMMNKATGIVVKESHRLRKPVELIAGVVPDKELLKNYETVRCIELRSFFADRKESMTKIEQGLIQCICERFDVVTAELALDDNRAERKGC
jgi:glycerate kinase